MRLPSWLTTFLGGLNFRLEIPPWNIALHVLIFGVRFDWTIAPQGQWLILTLSIGDWIVMALNAALGVIEPTVQWGVDAWNETGTLWIALNAQISNTVIQLREFATSTAQSLVNAALGVVSSITSSLEDGLAYLSGQFALLWDSTEGIASATAQRIVDLALTPYSMVLSWYVAVSVPIVAFLNDPANWIINNVLDKWIEDFTRGLNRELDKDNV